mgnify:CR=1 FL=1
MKVAAGVGERTTRIQRASWRRGIRAEDVGAVDLWLSVDAVKARADSCGCALLLPGEKVRPPTRHTHHRFDDLQISVQRQSTPPSASSIALRSALRIVRQAIGGRHQHAGRADAALLPPVRQKRLAQPVGQSVRPMAFNRLDRRSVRLRGWQRGRRRPARRPSAPCRRRNRRRRSRSWCRSCRVFRAASGQASQRAPPRR